MQIVVTELPIEDALGRARTRFQQADERLSRALQGSASGLPWALGGGLAVSVGALALAGILEEQSPAVLASFEPWCALDTVEQREGWVLLAGTRADHGA